MPSLSRCGLLAVAVALAVLASSVRADGPISEADCATINPNATFTSCSQYTERYTDVLSGLPYDTIPAYSECVKERCVCGNQWANMSSGTIVGMQCGDLGWNESGYKTCNWMVECWRKFWECTLTAVMDRYNNGTALDAAETTVKDDIIAYGEESGVSYSTTNLFRSCRMIMCEAAASRQNCGLITCVPNNTQCFEYIVPPPVPYKHQLCTQGCRAVLVMMAVTVTTFGMAFVCCICCPAQVRKNKPLITENDDDDAGKKKRKGRRDSDAPDEDFEVANDDTNGSATADDADTAGAKKSAAGESGSSASKKKE